MATLQEPAWQALNLNPEAFRQEQLEIAPLDGVV